MKQRRDAGSRCTPKIDLPDVIKKVGIRHQKDCTNQGDKRRSLFGMGVKGKTNCRKENYTKDFLKAHKGLVLAFKNCVTSCIAPPKDPLEKNTINLFLFLSFCKFWVR